MRITTKQYTAINNRRKISKADQARLDAGLEPIEDEDTAQKRLVAYLERTKEETGRIVKFTAIPNNTFAGTYIAGNKYKSIHAARKQVEMGLRKGLPDLLIIYRDPKTRQLSTLFLEMKREKGGKVSTEQKNWIYVLGKVPNVRAEVAEGYDAAKTLIDSLIF
jgi:hypothetical protein